jgi:eukaryotic-like serine/threonine-protein kinase
MAQKGQELDRATAGTLKLAESQPVRRIVSSVSEIAPTVALGDSESSPGQVDPSPASFGGPPAERYEERKQLGAGGMGEVMLCKDGWIGREVAKKVARRQSGSRPGAEQRFLREVRIQGQLEHPSIVPVYDLGRDAEGATYFTMKRIKGMTLEEIVAALRSGDPAIRSLYTRRKLLTAMSQICLAVAFAHSRGVVHRDLKPANVMLGDFGEVYVLDWGVAKVLGSPEDAAGVDPIEPAGGGRTEAGALLGTPGYMSPEQIRGEVDRVSPQSDVYALGAILFELLALEPLHRAPTLEALFATTLAGVDARPSRRSPDRDVPPELDEMCRRATALEPADRFANAREMHAAIERFLDGERDTERRRELADTHAEAAGEALDQAARGGPDAEEQRSRAMRELGAALALDPTHQQAIDATVRALLTAPEELPPAAEAELRTVMYRDRRQSVRRATLAVLSWFVATPLLLQLGVRSWLLFGIIDVVLVSLIGYQWWVARTGNVEPKTMRWAILLGFLAVSQLSFFLGPFVLVPAMAVGLGAGMMVALRANKRTRIMITVLAFASVFGPALLQLAGVLPRSYAFEDGIIKVLPLATGLPPLPTTLFVIVATVITLASVSVMVGKATNALIEAERRGFGQAWRLRQLLPDAARPVTVPPPADSQIERCLLTGGKPARS